MALRIACEVPFSEVELSLSYVCPACGERVSVAVEEYDISCYSSPCDLCGSHGEVSVDAMCECGHSVRIEVREW